uniref:DUF19 domain-containing protein n=1 Tax=Rhabditophanes sp. KR3021 TaxID=114890 RepID=A0AC35TI40_9BILA
MVLLKYLSVSLLMVSICVATIIDARRWTEEDESRRIQMIKDQEKQLFEKEMANFRSRHNYREPSTDYFESSSSNLKTSAKDEKKKHSERVLSTPIIYQHIPNTTNWCYQCTSSMSTISQSMRQAVKNFLDLRRTSFPSDVVNNKCTKPEDLGVFKKQSCMSSYCQTLVLTDAQTGNAFTMRGCAEHFGAIDPNVLGKRDDNTCTKLHNNLEMYECICKNRKYCHAGNERSIPDSGIAFEEVKFAAQIGPNNGSGKTNCIINLMVVMAVLFFGVN